MQRSRTLWALVASVLACGAGVACAGKGRSGAAAPGSPTQASVEERTAGSAWYYHPTTAPLLLARYDLGREGTLYLGQHGDRWSADAGRRTVQVATDLAPTALVAVVRRGARDFRFVAANGTVYQSTTALGAFERSSSPPTPMVEVAASADTVLAVARGGHLWRSGDLGDVWQPAGPAGVRFADVAFAADGTALAFSVPERHWLSADQGRSWQANAGGPFGALTLWSRAGTVHAQGVLGQYGWQGSATNGAYVLQPQAPARIELPFAPPRGPSAAALVAKRAVLVDESYYELEPVKQQRGAWSSWSGPLAGPLHQTVLTELRCDAVKVAGFSRWLWLACAQPEGRRKTSEGDVLELWSSTDHGKTWTASLRLPHTPIKPVALAVGAQGRLLLSGSCFDPKPDCTARGIHSLMPGQKAELQPSIVPSLLGGAEQLLFAPDGNTAYALGRNTKHELLGLFVSDDGGRSFEPKSVSGVPVRRDGTSLGITAASAADQDTLSIAFSSLPGSNARLVWLDAEGRVLALSATPKERVTLGLHGSRAIAIDRSGGGVWESRNAGASWVEQPPLPGAVCVPSARSNECPVEVACGEAGCVFAESLTRIGWNDPEKVAPPAQDTEPTKTSKDEPRRAPIACKLTDAEWQRLAAGASAPTADQAALGNYAWFVLADDPNGAEASLWRVAREQGAAVEKRQLLAPLTDPAHFAYVASLQVEGAAAIRYRIPGRVGAAIGRVEVAWEDLIHGASQRVVLPEAGPYRNDDTTKVGEAAERALPALISVAEGGLYLQIHGESARDQATLFLDAHGVTRLPEMSWPEGLAKARGEFLRVGQGHHPVLFLGSTAIVRAARHARSWSFLAHSVGWADPESFATEQTLALGYWRGRPALHLGWSELDRTSGNAVVLPFLESAQQQNQEQAQEPGQAQRQPRQTRSPEQSALFAEPIVVPTQGDLASSPQICEPRSLADTPRVVAEPQWGTRHLVTVSGGGVGITLVTGAAVLHGTKQQPCAVTFEADAVSDQRDEIYNGLVAIDAPEQAWLFRRARDAILEYRRMSCEVAAPTN